MEDKLTIYSQKRSIQANYLNIILIAIYDPTMACQQRLAMHKKI
jgi:hypothetical protein